MFCGVVTATTEANTDAGYYRESTSLAARRPLLRLREDGLSTLKA